MNMNQITGQRSTMNWFLKAGQDNAKSNFGKRDILQIWRNDSKSLNVVTDAQVKKY